MKVDPTTAPQVNSLAARERSAQAPNATDFRQFAALRRGADANDPATLREVARQFESIFTKMMLDSMRSASFGDPMFGSDQVDMYQDMADDQLAVQLSQGRGLGLADMLIRQLGQGGMGGGAAGELPRPNTDEKTAGGVTPAQQREVRRRDAAACDRRGARAGRGCARHRRAGRARNRLGHFAARRCRRRQSQFLWHQGRRRLAGRERRLRYHRVRRRTGRHRTRPVSRLRFCRGKRRGLCSCTSRNPRYSEALGTGTDVRAFANALQRGGYATDPEYANKLVATFQKVGAQIDGRQSDAAAAPANVKGFKSADASPIPPQELSNG